MQRELRNTWLPSTISKKCVSKPRKTSNDKNISDTTEKNDILSDNTNNIMQYFTKADKQNSLEVGSHKHCSDTTSDIANIIKTSNTDKDSDCSLSGLHEHQTHNDNNDNNDDNDDDNDDDSNPDLSETPITTDLSYKRECNHNTGVRSLATESKTTPAMLLCTDDDSFDPPLAKIPNCDIGNHSSQSLAQVDLQMATFLNHQAKHITECIMHLGPMVNSSSQ